VFALRWLVSRRAIRMGGPQAQAAVLTAGDGARTVRREGHGAGRPLMPLEGPGALPSSVHNRTVPSLPPATMRVPSAEKTTLLTRL
jgi:hypothetical protein